MASLGTFGGSLNQAVGNFGKQFTNSVINAGSNALTNRIFGSGSQNSLLPQSISGLINPQSVLGGGLLLGSAMGRDEPGHITEARQFLRNQFTSPNAIADQFSGQLGALNQQFLPALQQQQADEVANLSQRFANAFPNRVGAQGAEFGQLSKLVSDRFLPQQQALMGELALNLVNRQSEAARTILDTSRPNALNEALGQLGGLLLGSQLFGGQGQLGGLPGQGQQTQQSGGQGTAQQAIQGALTDALLQGGADALGPAIGGLISSLGIAGTAQLLAGAGGASAAGAGAAFGLPGIAGLPGASLGASGGLLGGESLAALSGAGPGGSAGGGAISGFLGSGAGTALGGLGSAGGGFLVGRELGERLPNQATGALAGAAGGAATGAMIGSVVPGIGTAIGALIGGLFGAGGGFLGNSEAAAALKAQYRREDISSQADQVLDIGSYFGSQLQGLGIDPNQFMSFVEQEVNKVEAGPTSFSFDGISGTLDQQLAVAEVGGRLLLQALQNNVNPNLGAGQQPINSLDDVPGLREEFFNWLTDNTFSATNSAQGGGAPTNQFPIWWNQAL